MDDWPPLTPKQRRLRRFCAFWVLVGLADLVWGSIAVVTGNPVHAGIGVAQVVVGAGSLAAGIFCWPTRWRNRLREIRDEMKERTDG